MGSQLKDHGFQFPSGFGLGLSPRVSLCQSELHDFNLSCRVSPMYNICLFKSPSSGPLCRIFLYIALPHYSVSSWSKALASVSFPFSLHRELLTQQTSDKWKENEIFSITWIGDNSITISSLSELLPEEWNCGILNQNKSKHKIKPNDPAELFLLC